MREPKEEEHCDELSIIEASKGQPEQPRQPMTREAQTAWIVGTLLVIAVIGLAIGLKVANDDPRYPGCSGLFGIQDSNCRYEHASRRLGGRYY